MNGMVDDAFSVSMRERLAVARGDQPADQPADLVLSDGGSSRCSPGNCSRPTWRSPGSMWRDWAATRAAADLGIEPVPLEA